MSAAGDIFNRMIRADHEAAQPPDPEAEAAHARREAMKDRLQGLADDGDKDALASLHRMQIADGERRPPARADGGEGRNSPPPGPSATEQFNESVREALHRKRGRRMSGGGFRDRFIRHGVEGDS